MKWPNHHWDGLLVQVFDGNPVPARDCRALVMKIPGDYPLEWSLR